MISKYTKRFSQLEQQIEDVVATEQIRHTERFGTKKSVNSSLLLEWRVKVQNLLVQACGEDSEHYKAFVRAERPGAYNGSYDIFLRARAVFRAAKEDYEGGYMESVRSLIQAEVFEDELAQAQELLDKGYYIAAAVIAGVVLETGIRELCDRHSIPHGKLDKMNADLARAGVYNVLQQKQITAMAAIRNSAAHGKPEEFNQQNVEGMIRDVRHFLAHYLPV